jgi:hypothetical protein
MPEGGRNRLEIVAANLVLIEFQYALGCTYVQEGEAHVSDAWQCLRRNGLCRRRGLSGIADEIRSKAITLLVRRPSPKRSCAEWPTLGLLQISEWLPVKGAEFLGPLPPDIQEFTSISAGLGKSTASPEVAKVLLKFLISPEAAPAKKKTGLESE